MGRTVLTLVLALTAGCGVKLSGGGTTESQTADAPDPVPIDAALDAQPDARPCLGGDAHVSDASGSCYVLFTAPKLRAAAITACDAISAHLVKIDSAATNMLVTTLAGASLVQIGANDIAVEGTFVWADGTPVVYTNWRASTNEPNNGNGQYQEDCAVLTGAQAGVWDDRPCAPPPVGSGSYAYVCQY
jgi:hypothetical protein